MADSQQGPTVSLHCSAVMWFSSEGCNQVTLPSCHSIPSFHGKKKKEEKLERVTDFIFLSSKNTADGDYSHKIQRQLLLGRKTMTNLHSILKSRDITLPTKDHLV